MRHLKRGRHLNRSASHRTAMLRNMACSLFEHGKIVTTPAKAKECRPFAEKMITLGKSGTLHDRRRALSLLNSKRAVAVLFNEIAPRFANRAGGYSRILRLPNHRIGDGAPQVIFELVGNEAAAPAAEAAAAE